MVGFEFLAMVEESRGADLKVLWIIPGSAQDPVSMVFAKRLIPLISKKVELKVYYVSDRQSVLSLCRNWYELKKIVQEFRPDLVHAQYGSVLGFLAWMVGKPLVVTFRGSDVNGDPYVSPLRTLLTQFLSRWVAQRAKLVICVTKEIAIKVLRPDALVMPSPIDLELFRPIEKQVCRAKLGLSQALTLVGFAGGDRPLKRRTLAKAAAERAAYGFVDIQNVSPQEMPYWLNALDALIFTSIREGSPNIVREALACGVPVVSVDVGDVAYWISRDKKSVVVGDTVDALSNGLKKVVCARAVHERTIDLSQLTVSTQAEEIVRLYNLH
jgi:teichuronic acid biosynthesis glycosyltransferase TuaC